MKQKKKRLSKRMDYLPAIFLQKLAISSFISKMNLFSAKDRLKLKTMIADYWGSFKFYVRTQELDTATYDDAVKKLKDIDEFHDDFVDMLVEMFTEATYIAGLAGLLPDYKAGEPIAVAGEIDYIDEEER